MKNPVAFISSSLIYMVFQFIAILVAVAILLIAIFLASALKFDITYTPLLAILSIVVLVYSYFAVAFNGSLINSYNSILDGNKIKFLDFYKYAMEKGFTFFGVCVAKSIVLVIFITPLLLLYYFVLKDLSLPYLEIVVGLILAFLAFLAHFIFFAAPIHAVTSQVGFIRSISMAFGTLKQKHISAFLLYLVYAAIWLTLLVPLVNIVTLLVLYPIILSALIMLVTNRVPVQLSKPKKKKFEMVDE